MMARDRRRCGYSGDLRDSEYGARALEWKAWKAAAWLGDRKWKTTKGLESADDPAYPSRFLGEEPVTVMVVASLIRDLIKSVAQVWIFHIL